MDKLLYISMSGAKQNLIGVSVKANNLANASTVGFKADLEQARSMQAFGEGHPTRVFAMEERPGSNMSMGALSTTGRNLDVSVSGGGWFTVQDNQGEEAYSRSGNLHITKTGQLLTARGEPMIGEGGPIILPVPIEKIQISDDGTIQVRPQGAPANFLEEVDRLKVVVPENQNLLEKGLDGLFRPKDKDAFNDLCGFCDTAPNVRVMSGTLEMSNVNPVDEMVGMIAHQRQFELQVKMMKTAEKIDESQSSLMRII
ncbi:flagellar basal-body rod protein FlgF [Pseudoalteromonas ulvae UL12]|uniref:Flagellar basal-body rod protein FlgF n=1 Tax=Pseudoalteromonas ulvae TaxID=107327 RepID=A0A244CSL3_PSEDV|nr:flagellar basal body rod protein FlgF [Pseudoalteromonas ulvae]MBE0363750.1 flagellar basal-body rod protein FlgF [Pseudoalteromonas ulvae UL12]OUL58594.1 flagellar biosynthesis protein FlgF [Pseudoalteromonas ulvae]